VGTLSAEAIERIQPPPLSIKGVKTHLTNLLAGNVSDALVRVVDKRSRGNPLQVEEITRQLVDKGDFYQTDTGQWEYLPPPGSGSLSQNLVSPLLANAFTRQLEKLSPESRARLTVAALLEAGPEFDFGLWVEALGGEPERAAAQAVVAEAGQRRILREVEDGRRYVFRQADVSKALVAELSPEERRQRHRQIAALCVNRGNVQLLAAYHLEQAGQATQSAQYLEGAGQKAASENNLTLAVDCYNRAVNLVPTVAGYGALGHLYRQLGAWAESRAAFKQALDLAVQEGEVEQQARILNGLAFTLWLSDNYREAGEVASAVLKLRPVSAVEQATAQSHLGMISWLRGHLSEAEEWCRRAVMGLLSSGEDDRLAEAYNRLGLVYYTTGHLSQATQAAQLSLQLRQKLRQQWGEGYSLVNLGQIEAEQGHFAEAAQFFSQARSLFEALTSSDGLMVVDMEEGRSLLLQGNVNDAVLLLGRSLHGAREMKKRTAFGLGDINLLVAEAALRLNDLERAKSAVTEALALVEPAGNRKSVALGQAIRARIFAAEGQPAQAESMFTQAISQFADIGYPAGVLRTQLQYAQFLAGQGRAEAAAQLQSQARAEAQRLSLYV
jgi:tetratricopeptide (TPR) repeat protein